MVRSNESSLDNPELWKTQPVCLQVVGMPYRDEELIAAADIIDSICNAE